MILAAVDFMQPGFASAVAVLNGMPQDVFAELVSRALCGHCLLGVLSGLSAALSAGKRGDTFSSIQGWNS